MPGQALCPRGGLQCWWVPDGPSLWMRRGWLCPLGEPPPGRGPRGPGERGPGLRPPRRALCCSPARSMISFHPLSRAGCGDTPPHPTGDVTCPRSHSHLGGSPPSPIICPPLLLETGPGLGSLPVLALTVTGPDRGTQDSWVDSRHGGQGPSTARWLGRKNSDGTLAVPGAGDISAGPRVVRIPGQRVRSTGQRG